MVQVRALTLFIHVGVVQGQLGWLFPSPTPTNEEGVAYLAENAEAPDVTVLASGLQYKVLSSGSPEGASPRNGMSQCTVLLNGSYVNGTSFEGYLPLEQEKRSKLRETVVMVPGAPMMHAGITEALLLMRPGDKWALALPANLTKSLTPFTSTGGDVLLVHLELVDLSPPSLLIAFQVILQPYLPIILMLLYHAYQMTFGGPKKGKPLTVAEAAAAQAPAQPQQRSAPKPPPAAAAACPRVFLDVTIGGDVPSSGGRIEFELFSATFPRTAENFRALCTGEKGDGHKGKPRHYKGTPFHRVLPGFLIQGGDTTAGNGTGGESIYATSDQPYFDDEFDNGVVGHSEPFLLSMANAGQHTNGSQFFVTTAAAPHLDGKNVVFGRVVNGQEVVKAIEAVGSRFGRTRQPVKIVDCGELDRKGKQE